MYGFAPSLPKPLSYKDNCYPFLWPLFLPIEIRYEYEYMSIWVYEYFSVLVCVCMSVWVYEYISEYVSDWVHIEP